MKSIKLLVFLAISALVFQGCKQDEDAPSIDKADLIGVWSSTEITIDFIKDGESYTNEDLNSAADIDPQTIEFKSDYKYVSNPGTDEEEEGSYILSIDGRFITFDVGEDDSYVFEIVAASQGQMTVKMEEDFSDLAELAGIEFEEEFTLVATINMVKD